MAELKKTTVNLPSVSVVMPSLNQVGYLEVAVRSVMEQSYPALDLVVVDGMSSDGSIELLMRLQHEYGARLQWVSQKDTGPAQAINRALALAQGEVIGWLNSDDMYMPDAVAKAVAHLDRYPKHQLVYGEAQHVDAIGRVLGRYPTQGPSAGLDRLEDGSFICQPTVFMRRHALDLVGPLDESLHLAFDFDLWLRFFKRFPKQVGMVRRVQACSRLHSACLTHRERQAVALEGMQVIQKHLGRVPEHWLWTHVDELCANYPLTTNEQPLVKQIEGFLLKARPFYQPEVLKGMLARLKTDFRLGLSQSGLYASVQPDGWVSKEVAVKYRFSGRPAGAVLVQCKAPWPVAGKLRLRVRLPSGDVQSTTIDAPDDFVLRLEVPELMTHAETEQAGQLCWTIEAQQGFVPAKHDKASTDKRKLAFMVTQLGLENNG